MKIAPLPNSRFTQKPQKLCVTPRAVCTHTHTHTTTTALAQMSSWIFGLSLSPWIKSSVFGSDAKLRSAGCSATPHLAGPLLATIHQSCRLRSYMTNWPLSSWWSRRIDAKRSRYTPTISISLRKKMHLATFLLAASILFFSLSPSPLSSQRDEGRRSYLAVVQKQSQYN